MSTALGASFKKSITLVEFADSDDGVPGHVVYYRYTDRVKDYKQEPGHGDDPYFGIPIDLGTFGKKFYSVPSMEVHLGQNTGVFEAPPYSITMPQFPFGTVADPLSTRPDLVGDVDAVPATGFVALATNGEPHSAIKLKVWEIVFDPLVPTTPGAVATLLQHFSGNVLKTTGNYQGKPNNAYFEAYLGKAMLKVPAGIIVNDQCAWTFGEHKTCKIHADLLSETGFLTVISGKTVTIPGLTGGPIGGADKWWHRGFVSYKGRRIGIRDWSPSDPTHFQLLNQPPAAWLGASVTVTPGCDKTITTCRARYHNELNFGGMGHAIPAWNPIYETPGFSPS